MAVSLPSHIDRFFENMIEMSNFVYDLVNRIKRLGYSVVSPELVQLATGILQGYNRKDLIEGFIGKSQNSDTNGDQREGENINTWDKIFEKDENFMHDNAFIIFSNLPSHHVEAFKSILLLKDSEGKSVVDEIDRETLWKFFHSYVRIAIKFIHEERDPYCRDNECRYATKYFPNIRLDYHAKKWNVKLPFPQKN